MSALRRLDGQVALVTGAGGGLGRAHAVALAAAGARVVVNDPGRAMDGSGATDAAETVAHGIAAAGDVACADRTDVGDWNAVGAMIERTIAREGRLDILVNNAGILRPRTLVSMSEDEMGSVVRVHLMGTAAATHFAAQHWRDRFKATGIGGGRLINTTSGSGLFGYGQANYAAAKAGIAALTAVAAAELARYAATANAIAPTAATRMSEGIALEGFDTDHVARLVCWLASPASAAVTGQVFQVGGGHISIVARSHVGPAVDRAGGWDDAALDEAIPALVARATGHPDVMGYRPGDQRSPLLPDIALPDHSQGSSQ